MLEISHLCKCCNNALLSTNTLSEHIGGGDPLTSGNVILLAINLARIFARRIPHIVSINTSAKLEANI